MPFLAHHRLLISIIISSILAAFFGAYFPEAAVSFKWLGDLFLNALKMMVLPLIITSILSGILSLGNVRKLGPLGLKTVVFYFLTTLIAVAIGIVLVNWIRPGEGFHVSIDPAMTEKTRAISYSMTDLLTSLIHPNLIQAAANFDILPLIITSILFGISFSLLGERAAPMRDFFLIANDAVMQIVHWIIFFTPVGVFSLIAYRLGLAGGGSAFWSLLMQLGKYCGTVLLGLIIHGVVILPCILFFLGRRNPMTYAVNMSKALLTSFATSSSSATLPVTIECVTKEAKVSKRVSNFVLPLGATMNMDGTALYEAVAAIFIAQSYGIELSFFQQFIILITATLAAIGAAGIPEAGLVTMVLVLQSVGLPVEGIGLILAIDWFLDRSRTIVNVWGDSVGAAVIDRFESGVG